MGWSVNGIMLGSDGPENLKILKKSWEMTLDHVDSWIVCLNGRQLKLGSDHDGEKCGLTIMLRNWDWTTRCAKRLGVVSIVWLWMTFKNCLFTRVEEPNSEVNIKTFVPEQQSPPVYFVLCFVFLYICLCICVVYNKTSHIPFRNWSCSHPAYSNVVE